MVLFVAVFAIVLGCCIYLSTRASKNKRIAELNELNARKEAEQKAARIKQEAEQKAARIKQEAEQKAEKEFRGFRENLILMCSPDVFTKWYPSSADSYSSLSLEQRYELMVNLVNHEKSGRKILSDMRLLRRGVELKDKTHPAEPFDEGTSSSSFDETIELGELLLNETLKHFDEDLKCYAEHYYDVLSEKANNGDEDAQFELVMRHHDKPFEFGGRKFSGFIDKDRALEISCKDGAGYAKAKSALQEERDLSVIRDVCGKLLTTLDWCEGYSNRVLDSGYRMEEIDLSSQRNECKAALATIEVAYRAADEKRREAYLDGIYSNVLPKIQQQLATTEAMYKKLSSLR